MKGIKLRDGKGNENQKGWGIQHRVSENIKDDGEGGTKRQTVKKQAERGEKKIMRGRKKERKGGGMACPK